MKKEPTPAEIEHPLRIQLTASFLLSALVFTTLVTPASADILRGGATGTSSSPAAPGSTSIGGSVPADTTQARASAQDALSRTTNTLQALRNMQAAASAASQTSTDPLAPGLPAVPNGLGVGGLNPTTDPAGWTGAELPTETIDADGLLNVGIRQTAQQALLDWQTFNVGKETVLNFDQSAAGANAAQWIAFNRIIDPTGNPSQILGQIKAQGQVYVINPNGIIFGGSSQVDVNTLTLSSLPINTNLIDRGLLNNPDSQFLFSGINLPAGTNGTPAFTPDAPPVSTGRYGDIIIQAGATIETPVSADGNGGRVLLVGPNVTNHGSIITPAGQTILAAGLQAGFTAHDAADPSLRGLDTYIGQIGSYGGTATNNGLISAERGNITLAGSSIHNDGALSSTTSVSLNGRIDLLAHYGATSNPTTSSTGVSTAPFLNRQAGSITLGEGSLISILPEYDSVETTIGTELALRSIINLEGLDLRFGANSTLFAPNAIVRAAAGEWFVSGGVTPISRFIQSAGRIDIGEDALLNVAGSIDVEVSVAQNIIEVDLRGAELADSPLQRTGVLRGETVSVDIRDAGIYQEEQWLGTPLADISGFANLIQRDVAQLTTAGGSITLSAGQSAIVRDGAIIDVSGGSISYQDAVVRTTQLITGGRLVDISQATPDVIYDGIYDGSFDASDPKWGTTAIYQAGLVPGGRRLETGYLEGAAGGALSITSPGLALDGQLLGKTFAGEFQRTAAPTPSSLTINFTSIDRSFASLPSFSPTPPEITFLEDPSQVSPGAIGDPLAPERIAEVLLPLDLLSASGFGNFTLNNPDGSIEIPAGSVFRANPFSNLAFTASQIAIEGSILAPGGNLSFLAPNLTLAQLNTISNTSVTSTPVPNADRGVFTLGENGVINTAGILIDDRINYNPNAGSQLMVMDGGSVTINAFDTILSTGGLIDVSGGARADARARITYGNAGSISATGGRDPNVVSVLGGSLQMGATLTGLSGARGGSLSLFAPAFQIGGSGPPADVLLLDPNFFNQGGFSNFSLTGIGLPSGTPGVLVAENTQIRPTVQSLLAVAPADQPLAFFDPILQPEGVRDTVSISLASTGALSSFTSSILARGAVTLGSGSSIITDANGSVSINSQLTTLLGSILTPGGSISASGGAVFPSDGDPPLLTTLLIGSDAILDASGKTVLVPDPFGLRSGSVLAGGEISLSGNILAHQGSMLIANGASGVLDLVPAAATLSSSNFTSFSGRNTTPVTVHSAGGVITLAGSSFLHSDATLVANAGGASAIGGSLNISSSRFVPPNAASTSADINLVITGSSLVTSAANPQTTGTLPRDENGNPVAGLGRVSIDSFASGGFHNLTLGGNVRTEGDISITMPGSVRLASTGVLDLGGALSITAGHIHAGQNFRAPVLPGTVIEYFTSTIPGVGVQPLSISPTAGSGALSLNAGLLDLGTLSLQNTGSAAFNAPQGDVRGNGILQAAGDLAFTAGQVYPTTGSAFSIFAYGGSSVSFQGGSNRALPFSAGGTLNVHAATITQNGVLRAPIGSINLGWNGAGSAPVNPVAGSLAATPITPSLVLGAASVTSTSAIDPITGLPAILPYGISPDGESWIDPTGLDITTTGPASKDIKLAADNLTTEEGSIIDIAGGGDLLAYRFVSGNGGTSDILASQDRFAIIPGYAFDYSPYAPFNTQAETLQGDPGYVNSTLRPGDQITLAAGSGLPAGTYTLLPARYALLPGAFLITPQGGTPATPTRQADGSTIVTGYIANNLSETRTGATTIANFEVAPAATFLQRAEYQRFEANQFFTDFAQNREIEIPRLPSDAGILSFTATSGFSLAGSVLSARPEGARGALIDLNSPVDIFINATGTGGTPGTLTLSSALLNSFGADSLLIGGVRTQSDGVITVNTSTNRLTLDNEDATLIGNDIILTAREELRIADNATIRSTGDRSIGSITLGTDATAGSGNGALVRVSGSLDSAVSRLGVSPGGNTALIVGENAILEGGSVILDSTSATNISTTASLLGSSVTLSSGEISLALENAGTLQPTTGIILGGDALSSLLSNSTALTLNSYSNLNLYGTGQVGSAEFESLTLQASAIRGLNQASGNVTLAARNLTLGNPNASASTAPLIPDDGTLTFASNNLDLSGGNTSISGFSLTTLNATNRILTSSEGSLAVSADLSLEAPVLTGLQASRYSITSAGALSYTSPNAPTASQGGLGADLSLTGSSVSLAGNIVLPSGRLTATSTTGDLLVSGSLDLSGTSRQFTDVTRYTSGGIIELNSQAASVRILETATLNLSAPTAGGNAGQLNVTSPNGSLEILGTLNASAGVNGSAGRFTLDTSALPSLADLDETLNLGSFTNLRDYRVRSGDVLIDSVATSSTYRLAADTGNINVTGSIDASGTRGGVIDLKAGGSLTLASGAVLDASADTFDAAGKGGAITLEAGTQSNGIVPAAAQLSLLAGSSINLSVAEFTSASAALGEFTGTLHLRAPRNAANTDLQIDPIGSTITGASAITVEGYKLYDRTGIATLDNTLLNTVRSDATAFMSSANYNAMLARLTSIQPSLDPILMPGVEIINRSGSLTLGSQSSATSNDWNLATMRYGPRSAPGVLTLRATGDIALFNAISDGFNGGSSLWLSPLIAHNPLLPANSQSWSYRFTAGADVSAASFRSTVDAASLAPDTGHLRLGKNLGSATVTGGANALTSSIVPNNFQVIRTGSGDIDIHTAGSVRFLNPFASIYTAGTQVANPTQVSTASDFILPVLTPTLSSGSLGANQQVYPAQYSMAGGNVNIHASGNIERLTQNNFGLITDSSRQLPNHWLHRRGYVDSAGEFGRIRIGTGPSATADPAASTTWWINFSNFFQSVGTLGGGNINLAAGNDVVNVDAVAPTNARASIGLAANASFLELGGGDVTVTAGNDISGGIYYVERGQGTLKAGGAITTNAARSPSFGLVTNLNNPAATTLDPLTWMPTTLFVGKSSFDLTAASDLLLGPVSNPFLLPQGITNRFWYKTYFSTIAADSEVTALSLGGDLTYRNAVSLPNLNQAVPALRAWHETQLLLGGGPSSTAWFQPWLRLNETSLAPFSPVWSLSASSLDLTALTGDLNLVGDVTTFPSPTGQIELLAAGSINALNPIGVSNIGSGVTARIWAASTLNLSDANPLSVPSSLSPLTTATSSTTGGVVSNSTTQNFMSGLASLFVESGAYTGIDAVLETRQSRHTAGGLHINDPEPLRIYSQGGDLSGLTLFSGKEARINAAGDITDIAFYIQNNRLTDRTVISAGGDIVAFNATSASRIESILSGNALASNQSSLPGDIQISGPGDLQVIAGGNLDLGAGSANSDGTGAGISSIGNLRNPFLTSEGANITALAGIGPAFQLSSSLVAIDAFLQYLLSTPEGSDLLDDLIPGVDPFSLTAEERADLAIEAFFITLRDSGRDFNNPDSPDAGTYRLGVAAIAALFGDDASMWDGDILARARDIRTRSGGDISLLAPGGGLSLASTAIGNPLTPPGIITESGGSISIFTDGSVDIGIGRIFTLRGGDAVLWSTNGDIAAGSSSRTVQSAPPTRVFIDPQSASIQTDLAGLATGGGIGVLATVEGVEPGDVDLIAPSGTIDAGDAGIRVSGNINIAAVQVVNAGNISSGGSSTGGGAVSAPAVTTVSTSPPQAATAESATRDEERDDENQIDQDLSPSIYSVEVIGYGGASSEEEEEDKNPSDPAAAAEGSAR